MKKKIVGLFLLFWVFFSCPLLAEEQLMTKMFFDNWLKNATRPLESNIMQLKTTYAAMEKDVEEIRKLMQTEIKVAIGQRTAYIDGQAVSLDVAPIIINGRTMVPVRFIGEAFGAEFLWDGATRKVTYLQGKNKIEIYVDKQLATVNGKNIILDTAPLILEGRTLVPLRFVSEHMDALVEWDGQTQTVMIHG